MARCPGPTLPIAALTTALLLAGCTTPEKAQPASSGASIAFLEALPAVKTVADWTAPDGQAGLRIETAHYRICTTVTDPLVLRQVPVFLESALRAYRDTAGVEPWPLEPLTVFLFASRQQWEAFTDTWAGETAQLYRRIEAGAYFLNGAIVAYQLDRQASFAVLAHEGWHQYAQQCFTLRLPAWLDELMATQFEAFTWDRGRVSFDARANATRLAALGQCLAAGQNLTIEQILPLDAGRVLSLETPAHRTAGPVAGYYAQLYALGRFLREADYGRHQLDLQALLRGAARGDWPLDHDQRRDAAPATGNPSRRWNSQVGPLLFAHYIARDPARLEPAYQAFCRKLLAGVTFEEPR